MSAIFNFSSLILVVILMICTCTYIRELRPTIFDGGLVSHECEIDTFPMRDNDVRFNIF